MPETPGEQLRRMSERLTCPTCGNRDETSNHIGRCKVTTTARREAQVHAIAQGIPAMTADDLWAHLGHVATPQDATRIVRQVVDLGWRPVVGKDPRRKWNPDPTFGRDDTETDETPEETP